jgi:NCS2 family nucleobase:cation symporter-2
MRVNALMWGAHPGYATKPDAQGESMADTTIAGVQIVAPSGSGKPDVHPVDEVLAPHKLAALGLQHVLVMYAGAIAVPLIIGRALSLTPEQVAILINADLLACGIVTIIQSLGVTPYFGIRLPVMMGVTFAAVGPMLAIAGDASLGDSSARLLTVFGSTIAAGAFTIVIAPVLSYLLPLFPPVVTGSLILMIGITLMRVGVNWAAGAPVSTIPTYGDPFNLGMAGLVMLTILLITRFVRGFFGNIAVLLGIAFGCIVAYFAFQAMPLTKVEQAPWFAIIHPFQFGMPQFNLVHIATMCVVMIVVMIESAGMFLALADMTGRRLSQDDMTRGLRADGLGAMIGGIMNTFPYTSFSQNTGLVGVTGIRSRWVTVTGGAILVLMGWFQNSERSPRRSRSSCSVAPASSCSAWLRRPAFAYFPMAGVAVPPKGILLQTPDQIKRAMGEIRVQAVLTQAMPPNNVTQMTANERRVLAAWLESR